MAYQIIISDEVFSLLNAVVLYLESKWSKKDAENFLLIFYSTVHKLMNNPTLAVKHLRTQQ